MALAWVLWPRCAGWPCVQRTLTTNLTFARRAPLMPAGSARAESAMDDIEL
jgi:hypothetical protein